jgi:N-acetylneuraminate synthase
MQRSFSLNNFIAEIGVNHENDMSLAKQMIFECSQSGIGCVKFQSYKSSNLAAPISPAYWDTSKETTTSQSELFSKYDCFEEAEYHELHAYCKKLGIEFMSTPFDVDYVKTLSKYLDRYKIASVDLTNYILLEAVAKEGKPVILSTGASTTDEINETVNFLSDAGISDITLLHCVINYPTDFENAGLGNIILLKNKFPNLKIGYSDHTIPKDSHTILPLAISIGAEVIEKHYTHNKNLPGNDHYHAFDKDDLDFFVKNIVSINKALKYADIEIQRKAISFARRGLYTTKKLYAGDVITKNDLCPLRPQLDFISPKNYQDVIGKKLINDIDKLTGISYSDIENLDIN